MRRVETVAAADRAWAALKRAREEWCCAYQDSRHSGTDVLALAAAEAALILAEARARVAADACGWASIDPGGWGQLWRRRSWAETIVRALLCNLPPGTSETDPAAPAHSATRGMGRREPVAPANEATR